MNEFVFPSDLDRAECDDLNRACEQVEVQMDKVAELEGEVELLQNSAINMGRMLTAIVNITKGRPPENTCHSTHDAVESVQQLHRQVLALRDKLLEAAPQPNAAVAAIQFALETDCGKEFLHCWAHGEFDAIRQEWPEAPDNVFIGADPLYKEKTDGE